MKLTFSPEHGEHLGSSELPLAHYAHVTHHPLHGSLLQFTEEDPFLPA